jgi:hypothetical protein
MNAFEPPRLTTWLLQRLAPRQKRESLIGDLVERYRHGRSAGWYRRQAFMVILVGAGTDIRDHLLLAVRALVMCWTALFLLGFFTGAFAPVAVRLGAYRVEIRDTAPSVGLLRDTFRGYHVPWVCRDRMDDRQIAP